MNILLFMARNDGHTRWTPVLLCCFASGKLVTRLYVGTKRCWTCIMVDVWVYFAVVCLCLELKITTVLYITDVVGGFFILVHERVH